jgi:hypothetical protein
MARRIRLRDHVGHLWHHSPGQEYQPQLTAEHLARAKTTTQHILRDWDLIPWDDVLANDVVLSIRMASIDIDQVGDLAAVGGNLQVTGREDAKRILKSVYGDIKRGLCVTSQIVSGFDAVLLGNFAQESTKEGADPESWPIAIYMKFNTNGKIVVMTIALIDLHPLTDAIRSAARSGTLKAG